MSSASSRCPTSSRTATTCAASSGQHDGQVPGGGQKLKGYRIIGLVRERLPPHHQQCASDQQAGRLGRREAAHAKGAWRVKMFQLNTARTRRRWPSRKCSPRLQTKCDRRAGKPVRADRVGQIPGSTEVPVDHRPRLHAGLCSRRRRSTTETARRRSGGLRTIAQQRRRTSSTRTPRSSRPSFST